MNITEQEEIELLLELVKEALNASTVQYAFTRELDQLLRDHDIRWSSEDVLLLKVLLNSTGKYLVFRLVTELDDTENSNDFV